MPAGVSVPSRPSSALPVCRSLAAAAPADACAVAVAGGRAWAAAGPHAGWFAFRLELDRPPPDRAALERAFAAWDALGHAPGVDRRAVCWETELDTPWAPIPARYAPWRHLGWVRPPGPAEAADVRARPAAPDEVARVAGAAADPALGEAHAAELRWLYGGLAARGATVWSAWDGERPVAGAVAAASGGEARLRELWTAPSHRRRGLASSIVAAAVAADPSRAWSVACVEGADAERIYRRAGFRPASRFTTASCERT